MSFIDKDQRITSWQTKTKNNFIETSVTSSFLSSFFPSWLKLFCSMTDVWSLALTSSRGGSRIFFRKGCTRLLLYFNTNKPHSFFLGRIPVVLENRRSSQGGGVRTPCTLPLDPPLSRLYIGRLFPFFLPPRLVYISVLPSCSELAFVLGFNVKFGPTCFPLFCRWSPLHLSSFWCFGNLQNHPVSLKIYASLLIANSKSVLNIKSRRHST